MKIKLIFFVNLMLNNNKSDMPDISAVWFAASAYVDLMQPTEYSNGTER